MFVFQTRGRRPPHITGRRVKIVTRVGAPNERVPLRFHDAIVLLVDRCLPGTWNLAALISLSFCQADFAPTSRQECFSFALLFKV